MTLKGDCRHDHGRSPDDMWLHPCPFTFWDIRARRRKSEKESGPCRQGHATKPEDSDEAER